MSHTFAVEVSVANTDKKIRPGMFARATVNLGTEQHVVVPDVAIVKRAGSGERFVYVYRDGKVWFQPVQLGQRLGDKYELLSGVEDNAQIVIAGQANLSDGIEVIVEK
jgi:multidrug efflux pump subunit AcrA (membrane-fusion protein)